MSIEAANTECLERIQESDAVWIDIHKASDIVPDLRGKKLLHAGPPVVWEDMCGPMRGAIIGASIFEGWAKDKDEALSLAESGQIEFGSAHEHESIGPMAGVISPSMYVHVVRNQKYNIETYSPIFEGMGKVLRHGAYDETVIERLSWINTELADLLKKSVRRAGGIDIKNLIAQAIQMGDEVHNRQRASNLLYLSALYPHMVHEASPAVVAKTAQFIVDSEQFVLNSIMASCKAMLMAGNNIEKSTIVTTIARNGFETGIQVSGLGSEWFKAPAPDIKGVYFPGYSATDGNKDIGDSAITETIGLGSCAMAGAPTVIKVVGGTPRMAIETTLKLYEITAAEHDTFRIPALNFRGVPFGFDIRKVVETGVCPVINTGISHKAGGIGQIGAGLTEVPIDCFIHAVRSFAKKY